jgi:flavodoxin/Pyruvate/2-oxoacid:ferredoxin oxidoreductase delta subunit
MPKSVIAFFSQGGTTSKTAECIAKGLRANGFQVDFNDIKAGKPPDLRSYDLLGIGAPVYACRIPFNVSDYIRSLPNLNNMPVFAFNLYGTYPADAGGQLLKLLAKKGARYMGYFSCRGPEYNLGYLQKGYLFSPDNPTNEEMAQAEAFGHEVAGFMSGKGQAPVVRFHSPSFVYRLERMLCDRLFIEQLMTRTFKVSDKLCNGCGLCMKLCPNGNIEKVQNGLPKWGRHCLGCATCQMKCPKEAITSMLAMLGPMFDYNVRHMAKDTTLQFAKVRHHNGRTEKLP